MEVKEKKKPDLKISKRIMLIGGVIIVIGIICLIFAIGEIAKYRAEVQAIDVAYAQEMAEYNEAYKEWQQSGGSMLNRPQMPMKDVMNMPSAAGAIFKTFFSGVIILIGGVVLFVGAQPYITKFTLKHSMETLDYVGDDVTDLGGKVIDIGAPIIGKAVDDLVIPVASKTMDKVVVPTVKNIKKTLKDDDSEGANIYCKHCGKSIDENSKFCKHCGKEQ